MEPEVLRVVLGAQEQIAAVRARVLDYVTRTWTGLGSWHEADIDRFVQAVVPVVEGGQIQVAALTDAYLAQLESTVLGTVARPVGMSPAQVTTQALRGVTAAEVYRRPGMTVWTALAEGKPLDEAVDGGLARLLDIAATDLQLAKRQTAQRVLERNDRVTGYRRVLEGRRSCVLCVTASTQRYKRDQLLPIHGRCDCGVAPLYGDEDPGQVINSELLAELKHSGRSADLSLSQAVTRSRKSVETAEKRIDEVRAELADEPDQRRRARLEDRLNEWQDRKRAAERRVEFRRQQLADYRGENGGRPKTLIEHDHGELGPILGIRGQDFTGPSDI